jgi:two-component system phosphate regulon response regulator OmpR
MPGKLPLVYIVDDDAEVRGMVEQFLARNDIEAVGMASADEMLRRLPRLRPDLVVLDLMMPGTGGLQALSRLRESGDDLPVILLTARSDYSDRVNGLDLGADDYVGKPFNAHELLARIRANLRRRRLPSAPLPNPDAPLAIGSCVLDPKLRTLTRNGEALPLHAADFGVLRALTSHPLKPMSRDRLLELTSARGNDKTSRSIDVQILRLRRLIEDNPDQPVHLQTVRGVGYVFVP